jgi:hypothetical protein
MAAKAGLFKCALVTGSIDVNYGAEVSGKLCAPCSGWYSADVDCENRSDHAKYKVGRGIESAVSRFMRALHQSDLSRPRVVSLVFAFVCSVGFAARAHAVSNDSQSGPSSPQITSQIAIADFDGDGRPDLATVEVGQSRSWDTRYWIYFQLSSGPRQILDLLAPDGGLQIASRDVNADHFLDIIVTTAWTNRPVAILLNDGQGNFRATSPCTFPGAFTSSEKSWASHDGEIKDGTAVNASRYPVGKCPESRFSSLGNLTRRLTQWAAGDSRFSPNVSFLGRAPPSFIFHV